MSRALSGRDLLSIADLDRDEINAVLDLAVRAKAGEELGTPLRGLNLALIFQRPSNRTRVSFEVAINRLGGHPIALFGDEIRLGERETAGDIARILDRYADGVIARLTSQRDLLAIAAAMRGPVISGMTNAEHPCQLLADLMTVREATGTVAGARVAYIGDGNNVCTSWLYAAAITGIDLRIVSPPGYEPAEATSRPRGQPARQRHGLCGRARPQARAARRGHRVHRRVDEHGPGGRAAAPARGLRPPAGQRRAPVARARLRAGDALPARAPR